MISLKDINKARHQIAAIPYEVTEQGCHIPTHRAPNLHGYINTNFNYKQTKLHRLVAFAYLDLDLDDELVLALHKLICPNRACFNVEHIYVGNHSQNTKDAVKANTNFNASKILCKRGHEYDRITRSGKYFKRRCSQCRKIDG